MRWTEVCEMDRSVGGKEKDSGREGGRGGGGRRGRGREGVIEGRRYDYLDVSFPGVF